MLGMQQETTDLAKQAEVKNGFNLLRKSNALREKAVWQAKELQTVNDEQARLTEDWVYFYSELSYWNLDNFMLCFCVRKVQFALSIELKKNTSFGLLHLSHWRLDLFCSWKMEWSHGKLMEKSLNFIPNFQYEPWTTNAVTPPSNGGRRQSLLLGSHWHSLSICLLFRFFCLSSSVVWIRRSINNQCGYLAIKDTSIKNLSKICDSVS